jgi:proline dehydrogenase
LGLNPIFAANMTGFPEVDFDNTENAFQHKSTAELKKARLLFKSFDFPILLKVGPGMAKLAVMMGMKGLIKNTIFAQFCGGETIDESKKAIENLAASHVGTILDYSVEGEEEEHVFEATAQEILKTIQKAKGNTNIPFSVFKTTGIMASEALEWASQEITTNNLDDTNALNVANNTAWNSGVVRFKQICNAAAEADVRLFVDAEETWLQPAIDLLTQEAMESHNSQKAIVYNTLQMYRHDRLQHLKAQVARKKCHYGYKLVRGAYMEKERERARRMGYVDPIQPNKEATDRDYNLAVTFCLEQAGKVAVCIATHNEESSKLGTDLLRKHNVDAKNWDVSFSQLLGMSDHISFNLAHAGYNVAKYVPYGPVLAVIPYLTRRAQENSGVAGQMGRERNLIEAELRRRNAL